MAKVTVRIPVPLQGLTGNQAEVEVEGHSVGGALHSLDQRFPGLASKLLDEGGKLLPYVNVFLNDDNVRTLDKLDTAVQEGDELSIIPAIAGGAGA